MSNHSCTAGHLSRRRLLGATLAAGAAVALNDQLMLHPAQADVSSRDTLVVLSLRGGFDGLTAIPPIGDPDYVLARPRISVPEAAALPLTGIFGLHPALAPLLPWWNSGDLAIVQATGLPIPNRSHFSAMAEMERAAPGSSVRTGWLNRAVGLTDVPREEPFRAVSFGLRQPPSTAGPAPFLGLRDISSYQLETATSAADRDRWRTVLDQLHRGAEPHLRESAENTLASLSAVANLSTAAAGAYPATALGRNLRDAAHLIRSGRPISVITIDQGDWDMHVGLGTVDRGWMARNLMDLAASLAAFAADLGPLLSRVCLVTLSEFGRRVAENDSGGVDHGWGNAMLLLGGGVRGGEIHGQWPGLSPNRLQNGDLPATTDYRAVLADILVTRCGATWAHAQEVFPNWTGQPLGVTTARTPEPTPSEPAPTVAPSPTEPAAEPTSPEPSPSGTPHMTEPAPNDPSPTQMPEPSPAVTATS